MSKTEIQTQFDTLVSKVIWPEFKKRGYSKTKNNFRYYDSAGWGKILSIQKSAYGDRSNIRFTLNTGIYLPEAERLWTRGRSISNERFLEPACLIRKRIGQLKGSDDLWYELTDQSEFDNLSRLVEQDITTRVLPYLDRIDGVEAIMQQLIQVKEPNSELAIETLFNYGYQNEARKWIEDELTKTIYRTQRQKMLELQARLAHSL
ncbi:DUF4304 domain-containing protein [Hymenobacter fodinae]|uniref:DUF4304 domain-containing protein n=1 Tax=Hymenobacter fodinae TaxID=2510796 RepID=UPI001436C8E0|nr:DUF4304 domain-containing protein [Hymenobacter fodinae]